MVKVKTQRMISKKEIVVPVSFKVYVDSITEDKLMPALRKSTRQFNKLLKSIPKKKVDYSYAEGKWTIRELLQHVIDAERVFVSRALWFARKDLAPLPSFDENTWAVTAKASERKWKDLVEEFKAVRNSTETFFKPLDDEQLRSSGRAGENVMSVAGWGFVCAGHVAHHIRIVKERYLNKKTKELKKKQKA
jgi:uncharacterized damage-inducible protein DinB